VTQLVYSRVKDIATTFETTQFFEQQETIQIIMSSRVDTSLIESTDKTVRLMDFRVLRIEFEETVQHLLNT
jgi:hypothetical protein